jgi:hypothetical protein
VINADDSALPGSNENRQKEILIGKQVASPFFGLDPSGTECVFVCFPDLSVRIAGAYRLKFSLLVLGPRMMGPSSVVPVLASVTSNVFQVYNAKDFLGMRPSTELSKYLRAQGCLIPLRKDASMVPKAAPAGSDSEDERSLTKNGQATKEFKYKRLPKWKSLYPPTRDSDDQ